jgi:hypothetical protein
VSDSALTSRLADGRSAEDQEVARKTAEKAKQAQAFGSFFKPKPKAAVEPISRASPAGPSTIQVDTKPVSTDFYRTFKGIEMRPNVSWAEVNKWRRSRRRSQGKDGQDGGPGLTDSGTSGVRGHGASEIGTWDPNGALMSFTFLKNPRLPARTSGGTSLPYHQA